MKYVIELDQRAALAIRRGLGLLPYDEVAPLIEYIGGQMVAQEKAAYLPQATDQNKADRIDDEL